MGDSVMNLAQIKWEVDKKVFFQGSLEELRAQTDSLDLLCKLEGLVVLTEDTDFLVFRATIFECLGLINKIKQCLA